MRPPAAAVRKASVKRLRAESSARGEQRAPAPKRQNVQASPPDVLRLPPPVPEAGPVVSSPPMAAVVEEVAAERPVVTELPSASQPSPTEAEGSRERGPEEPSGTSPEEVPSSSPPNPTPGRTEAVEGRGTGSLPPCSSSQSTGMRAEQLLSRIIQDDLQGELRSLGVDRFYREACSALVRVANSMFLAHVAIMEGDAVGHQIQADAEEAEARAAAAERALESVRAECLDRIKAAEEKARSAEEKARLAENKMKADAKRLETALRQLSEAKSAVEARNLHIADLKLAVQEAEKRRDEAEEGISLKEAERAAIADSLASESKARASVEARAATVIEDFKASEEFSRELVEANAEYYTQGFMEAREKIARVFNLPEAINVEPDEDPETSDDDTAAAS